MPPPAPPRPPNATGSDSEPESLRALEPSTPSEVVQLAGRHLGLDPDVVIRRAADVLGPSAGGRSASDLARLWQILIDDHSARPDSNQPSERTVVREPVGDQGPEHHAGAAAGDESDPGPTPPDDEIVVAPDDPDDIDMNDLVDAPDHAEELIERLTEAFPGAELHTKEEPQQP